MVCSNQSLVGFELFEREGQGCFRLCGVVICEETKLLLVRITQIPNLRSGEKNLSMLSRD